MWTPLDPPSEISLPSIEPSEVLYFFDEPLIFVSTVGLLDHIFVKFDESGGDSFYFCAETNGEVVTALRDGKLSVRGALGQNRVHIIEADRNLQPTRIWTTRLAEIDERFLPERGAGLDHRREWAADTIEQADTFLSARFFGGELSDDSISLKNLRDLTASFYDAVRRLFNITELFGNQQRFLEFPVYEPQLGSLVLSIKRPVINESLARQSERFRDLDGQKLFSNLNKERNGLFDTLEWLRDHRDSPNISAEIKREIISLVDNFGALIPSERSVFSDLEITHSGTNTHQRVHITRDEGDAVKKKAKEFRNEPTSIVGSVSIINPRSSTFVIFDDQGGQTTAMVAPPLFAALKEQVAFRDGARARVTGSFRSRKYRGQIDVDDVEII